MELLDKFKIGFAIEIDPNLRNWENRDQPRYWIEKRQRR